ncbi:MAG: hypothetical protein JWN70_4428, partial [Planctomycetaceae bacterium]|nr:hypothetical protein [Planctomycetaceae bacterium]
PVRRRQRGMFALRTAVWGLLAGSLVAIGLCVARWVGAPLAGWTVPAVLVLGPVLGLIVGLVWKRSWHGAAVAVDQHYHLKDRTTTALAFLDKPAPAAYGELQLQDALEHLSQVQPQQVVPLRMPRPLPYALAATVLAAVLSLLSFANQPVQAAPAEPDPTIVGEADVVEEQIKELEKIAKEELTPELEQLVKELREKAEEMKQPGVDVKEALAKLSEMQASIQQQQVQFNSAMTEEQLKSVGEALSAAESLNAAAKALMEGKLGKAAEELEKLDDPKLDRKEMKAVTDKLKKAAEKMTEAGQESLSKATSQFCEGLEKCDGSCKGGAKKLAGECKKCEGRKKISDLLRQCQSCLGECKSNCQKNSTQTGEKRQKSTSPKNTFGMTSSGNIDGEKTDLNAKRNEERITGQQGDGESEMETTHEVEGKQQATRAYRDVYQKYRKMSESVLDSEEIPLGHRQMIRKYFELIRPQNGEGVPATAPAEAK